MKGALSLTGRSPLQWTTNTIRGDFRTLPRPAQPLKGFGVLARGFNPGFQMATKLHTALMHRSPSALHI